MDWKEEKKEIKIKEESKVERRKQLGIHDHLFAF